MIEFNIPSVMGILNVTPDSFSDGGLYRERTAAIDRALAMVAEGVDIIDVGGESTRPGAEPVSANEELDRTIDVIAGIRRRTETPISIDTSTAEVMTAAAAAGASMINDVRALRREGALAAAAATRLPVCLMHMQGEPGTMQLDPRYDDVVEEIRRFFEDRMAACLRAGISPERILLDPGFGFGKTPGQNLTLINRLDAFTALGQPVLVGLSRKSTIGRIVGEGDGAHGDGLLMGSVAGAVVAVMKGAAIVRVHDVAATVSALRVARAIARERTG